MAVFANGPFPGGGDGGGLSVMDHFENSSNLQITKTYGKQPRVVIVAFQIYTGQTHTFFATVSKSFSESIDGISFMIVIDTNKISITCSDVDNMFVLVLG